MTNSALEKLQTAAGVSKKPVTVPEMIQAWTPQIAKALEGTALAPERIGRIALTCFRKNAKLSECVPESVWAAIIVSAQMGLELGVEAHMIPFGKECTLVVDYKGYIQLAYRSGSIKSINADVVKERDKFTYREGLTQVLEHEKYLDGDRGKPRAAYAVARTVTGGRVLTVMTIDEINAIRDRSSNVRNARKYGKQTPWDTDYDEMAKKTVIRRIQKMLPRSVQDRNMQRALTLDNAADTGGQMLRLDSIDPDADLQPMVIDQQAPPLNDEPVPDSIRRLAEMALWPEHKILDRYSKLGNWDAVHMELEEELEHGADM